MTADVQSQMKLNTHPQQILLKGQNTGMMGVDPMQLILNRNGNYTPKTFESDEDDSSSPSPHPSRTTEVTYFEVKSDSADSGNPSQPTYRLLQPSGILDASRILQSHGLFEANQAAANYPAVTSGVTTVLVPSEAGLQHNLSATRSIAAMGDLSSVVYSPQTNGLPQLPNSASSDSCSPDINSQKPFIYAKPPTSPSPYTANTERARAFNAYVKQLIESRMDCKIPISLQPKHLVDDIMNDAKKHFPEFENCTRKRIRTFLKSCRRSKKFRQQIGDDYVKRPESGLNISPALGSSPDLAQIRPLTASGQTLIMPQFITQIPNSSSISSHHPRTITLPQPVSTSLLLNTQNNAPKVSTIPIAQHQFNTDNHSQGNISPTNSECVGFGANNTRRSSDSDDDDDDDMNTGGNNSEVENASTRPSTPPSMPSEGLNGHLSTSLQMAGIHNSRGFVTSPFIPHRLNGTTKLQQIPMLTNQGQIINASSEGLTKFSAATLAQVNSAHNRKRPSPTIEESQSKRLNGDVRSSLLNAIPALSGLSPYHIASSAITGNLGEYPNFPNGSYKLNESELREVQGMIDAYRLSATFLNRAALQLEKYLQNDVCKTENLS